MRAKRGVKDMMRSRDKSQRRMERDACIMAVVDTCRDAKVTFGSADVKKTVFKRFRNSLQKDCSNIKPSMMNRRAYGRNKMQKGG